MKTRYTKLKNLGMTSVLSLLLVSCAQPPPVAQALASTKAGITTAGADYPVKELPEGLQRLPMPQVAPPVNRKSPATVKVELETRSVKALLADGVAYEFWTYDGTVPGPMIRIRQGDTVELTLKNSLDSPVSHSIDSHAVTGPGGGAMVTQTPPGETSMFRFKALNPGVYIYHCGTPMIPYHIAHGMYGLMVVEPPNGWPKVDREFYVVQGNFYLNGNPTEHGLHDASVEKMLKETPDYIVFNGSVGALSKDNPLRANVGEKARIFFGVAGPNTTSSVHLIGEVFDKIHPEGALETLSKVQTHHVPAGGAAILDFHLDVPGMYILVDHSLAHLQKGAAGFLQVEGPENPKVFQPLLIGNGKGGGH